MLICCCWDYVRGYMGLYGLYIVMLLSFNVHATWYVTQRNNRGLSHRQVYRMQYQRTVNRLISRGI